MQEYAKKLLLAECYLVLRSICKEKNPTDHYFLKKTVPRNIEERIMRR